jgi:hypothetical protein
MLYLNTLGIQYKNKIYVLFSSNSSKLILFRSIKNYEYNLNSMFLMYLMRENSIGFFYNNKNILNIIYLYIYKVILEFLNIFILNFLFRKNIFIFIKYNFIYFFEKCNMYTYIDRFIYIIFINRVLFINNYINILKLIEIFSYNYLNVFINIFNNKNEKINIKYNYIILNRFLYKYINNIYLYFHNFVYNIETIKKYI